MQYREFTYNTGVWDTYFYEKNLQGDIVAIYDINGTKLATYTYYAYGSGSPSYKNGGANTGAAKNPFMYRGYYKDEETGLYYLHSRYYDPVIGRFISPDSYISTGQGLLGYNMYAYCNNNPVARVDDSGYMWQFVPALDPANFVYGSADGLPFAGGSSGYFKTSFDSSAYNTYQIRTKVTSYNANLGGYYYGGGSSFGGYTSQFAVGGKVSVTDNMATSGGGATSRQHVNSQPQIHGNSLDYSGTNYGYALVDQHRNILKFGETIHPLTRYSQKFLQKNRYSMIIMVQGTKRDVHLWQHDLNMYYKFRYGNLPPLNKRGW